MNSISVYITSALHILQNVSTLRPAVVFVVTFWVTSGAVRSVRYVLQDDVRRQNKNVAEELSRTKIRTFWARSEFGKLSELPWAEAYRFTCNEGLNSAN